MSALPKVVAVQASETLQRSEWLSVARQQSERLERQQQALDAPFEWRRVDRPRASHWVWGPFRVLALAALLLALVGSATWAFVTQRRREQTAVAPLGELLAPSFAAVGPAPLVRRGRAVVRQRITERAVSTTVRKPAAAVARRLDPPGAEPALPHRTGPQGGALRFGDEVIVVVPKAKLKPLFSVQEYRRKHR